MRACVRLTALLAILLASCAPLPAATTPTPTLIPVNVCYTAVQAPQVAPWYALENGIFAKYGLKVNLFQVGGSPQAVAAMLSGQADICQAVGSAVVNAVAAGQDIVMVAGIFNTYPAVLVAKPEIKSAADLRGKKVGTSPIGNAPETATRIALTAMGLDPDRDVELVHVGPEPEPFAAFQAGRVDAVLLQPPFLHVALAAGASKLFDFGKANVAYAHTSILTTRQYVAQHREIVLDFLKAIIESIALLKKDPQGTKSVLAKYLSLDLESHAADLEDTYRNTILPFMEDPPYPSLDGLQTVIMYSGQSNPKAAALTPAQLVDASLMQELDDNGFIRQVTQSP